MTAAPVDDPATPGRVSSPPGTGLAVVIVSWNTCGLLRGCLTSLFHGGLEGVADWAVTVIDNASTDGSAAMVRAEFPQVRLVENRENVGFARANNQALRETSGGYALLLNSDTLTPRGALARLIEALETHSDAGICSPLLLNADGSPQYCWARFPGARSELSGGLDLAQSPYPIADFSDAAARSHMAPFPVDWVGGACFLVRASLIARVGLLDEGFFMYSEETDWCHRFRQAGATTLLAPAVTVTHLGGQSSRRVPVETRARIYRSRVRLYRRLYGPVGGLLPAAIAWGRYQLFRAKHREGTKSE